MPLWYADITVSPSLTTAGLTDFPMTLYGDGWPLSGFWDRVRSDCMDLHFKLLDGTALDREIEAGSVDVASRKMICHVRLPSYSAVTGATIRAFFGDGASRANASGTWNSGYAAVWHCVQSPPASLLDSTVNGRNLTPSGMDASNVVTIGAGKGLAFDGATEYARLASAAVAAYPWTIEAIQRHALGQLSAGVAVSDNATVNNSLVLHIDAATNKVRALIYTPAAQYELLSTTVLSDSQIVHSAAVAASATSRLLYVGGAQEASDTVSAAMPTGLDNTNIGRRERSTPNYYAGALREVRISTVARSGAYVQASARALLSPGTYYTVGAVQPWNVTLAVADLVAGAVAEPVALSQTHALATPDLTATAQIDAVALTSEHLLGLADVVALAMLPGVALSQSHVLAVADALAQALMDTVALQSGTVHELTVADLLAQAHIGPVALSQAHSLSVADLLSAAALDAVALEQGAGHTLAVADLVAAGYLDPVALSQVHTLTVADILSMPALDAVALLGRGLGTIGRTRLLNLTPYRNFRRLN